MVVTACTSYGAGCNNHDVPRSAGSAGPVTPGAAGQPETAARPGPRPRCRYGDVGAGVPGRSQQVRCLDPQPARQAADADAGLGQHPLYAARWAIDSMPGREAPALPYQAPHCRPKIQASQATWVSPGVM